MSCTLRTLPSSAIRAAIDVHNTSSGTSPAYLYGPVFGWVKHVSPVLQPAEVSVTLTNGSRTFTYRAFALPPIKAGKTAHIVFRFRRSPGPLPLSNSPIPQVHADANPLDTPDCTIPVKP